MKPPKLLFILCIALTLGACNKTQNTSGSNTATSTKATTNSPASPAPTLEATNKSNVRSRSATPSAAAEGLFGAWKAKDRTAASKFAYYAAEYNLWKDGGSPDRMIFQGCEKTEVIGGYACGYYYEGGKLLMHVRGNATHGYMVEEVEFIAD